MSSRIRWLFLVVALVGLALTLEASWVHYRLLTDPSYISPCNLSTALSCSQLYLTHGRIAGVPVAFGGLVWFALVGLIAAFAAPDRKPSAAASYLVVLAAIGLGVVAFLAYTSIFVAKTGCVYCIGTYVCVLAILTLTRWTSPAPLAALPGRLASDLGAIVSKPATLTASLVYAAALVAFLAWFPGEGASAEGSAPAPSESASLSFAEAWARQPRVDLGIPADGAKVIIVKFNDFECPLCAQVEQWYRPVLRKMEQAHPGAVKYVMKDWPWSAACNFATTGIRGHEASCNAAAAARMARERGKGDEMLAWLFSHQGTTPDAVAAAATSILGLGAGEFEADSAKVLPGIRQDVADGQALNVHSTPTFFLNGVRLPDSPMTPAYFEMAINLELEKAAN
jgi:uncharacterized membrane protein/protein-disulfide isomerase